MTSALSCLDSQFASLVLDSTHRFARTSKILRSILKKGASISADCQVKEMDSKQENPPPYSEAQG